MMNVVEVEPDTDEWLAERRSSIGASEVAAAVGESSYGGTPLQVYLSKIGARGNDFDPLLSLIGHGAEPIISDWVEKYHPEVGTVWPGYMARHEDYPWLHATFDRIVTDRNGNTIPLQLKTSTVFVKHKWNLEVPVDYQIQEEIECLVMDAPYALLAVWHTGTTEFELFKLPAHADRQAALADTTRQLWECIESRTPPPPSLGDDLAAMYPASKDQIIEATPEMVEVVEFLRETAAMRNAVTKEYQAQEADAKFELEQFMQNAEVLIDPHTGAELHTWKETKSGSRRHYTPPKGK